MCTNYTPATPRHLLPMTELGPVEWPTEAWPEETYPGYAAPILMASPSAGVGRHVPALHCKLARFGLVPRWCKDDAHANKVGRGTYNARCETVADKPSFRGAWKERRLALVPMADYFEPCWETGRAVRWRISQADGMPLLAAALHDHWVNPESGASIHSFTLLTANADLHPLLNRMHRPGDEKRQLRLVSAQEGAAWLANRSADAIGLLDQALPTKLVGVAAPIRQDPQTSLAF